MSTYHIWAYILLALSIAALCVGIAMSTWRYSWQSKRTSRRIYYFTGFLLLSVFLLQSAYVVGMSAGNEAQAVSEIFSGTFQFFSLDADYSTMAECGPKAFVGGGVYLYYSLFCIYTMIVPIAGGFFLMQFLCSLIPRVRLFLNLKKAKFVFSELNERSITIAEDIARLSWGLGRLRHKKNRLNLDKEGVDERYRPWLKSACIIFTDAYSDSESENKSELLDRAKRIDAICLRDDILERSLHFFPFRQKKLVYFMIDDNQESNLVSAISLITGKKHLWKRTYFKEIKGANGVKYKAKKNNPAKTDNMEMYIFSRDDETASIVEKAFLRNCEQYRIGSANIVADCDDNIVIKVINEHRNLVYEEIFDDNNLFEKLTGVGLDSGAAASAQEGGNKKPPLEMSNAWYRALNYYLQKNKKSTSDKSAKTGESDDKDEFRVAVLGGGRIAKEFYKTVCWYGQMLSDTSRSGNAFPVFPVKVSVLAENAEQFKNALKLEMPALTTEYCEGFFHTAKFGSDTDGGQSSFEAEFVQSGAGKAAIILVAFGNDEVNIQAARWIERRVAARHDSIPTTVFYVVENSDLCDALEQSGNGNVVSGQEKCVMKVCGSLKLRLALRNIFMSQLERRGLHAERMHEFGCKDGRKFMSGYNRDSSVAATLHFFVKAFCLKLRLTDDNGTGGLVMDNLEGIFADGTRIDALENQLYWLEHRRWCAYMYMKGYRCLTAKQFAEMMFREGGNNKDDNLRLNACLLDSYADYHSIEDLLLAYAERCLPSKQYSQLESEVKKIKNSGAGIHSCRDDIVREIKKKLIEHNKLQEIKDKIAKIKGEPDNGMPLSAWLDDVFRGIKVKSNTADRTEYEMDALDKLSLIATLGIDGENKYKDFKSYDINIVRNLCLDLVRRRVLLGLAQTPAGKDNADATFRKDLDLLFKKWSGWLSLKAQTLDKKVSEDLDYDPVSWSENFEAIIVRGGSNFKWYSSKEKYAAVIEPTQGVTDKSLRLVEVPGSGSNCVGELIIDDKKYYVHMFHKLKKKSALLPPSQKKQAKIDTADDIEVCLFPDEPESLSAKRLHQIMKKHDEEEAAKAAADQEKTDKDSEKEKTPDKG